MGSNTSKQQTVKRESIYNEKMGLVSSKNYKDYSSMNKKDIENRKLYNKRLNYALENKLFRIQNFSPKYHGNWREYMSTVNILFVEDLHYVTEYRFVNSNK